MRESGFARHFRVSRLGELLPMNSAGLSLVSMSCVVSQFSGELSNKVATNYSLCFPYSTCLLKKPCYELDLISANQCLIDRLE